MSCSAITTAKQLCKLKLFKEGLCKRHYNKEVTKQDEIKKNDRMIEIKNREKFNYLNSLPCLCSKCYKEDNRWGAVTLYSIQCKLRNHRNLHCIECKCRYCVCDMQRNSDNYNHKNIVCYWWDSMCSYEPCSSCEIISARETKDRHDNILNFQYLGKYYDYLLQTEELLIVKITKWYQNLIKRTKVIIKPISLLIISYLDINNIACQITCSYLHAKYLKLSPEEQDKIKEGGYLKFPFK